MNIKLQNPTSLSYQRWQEVALPYGDHKEVRMAGPFPLIKLRDVGDHSTIYAIRPPMNPGQIRILKVHDEIPDGTNLSNFAFHPLVIDDLSELLPTIELDGEALPLVNIEHVEKGPARAVFRALHSNGIVHADSWFTIWSMEPWVRVQSQVIYCDHAVGSWTLPVNQITWTFGEPVYSDFLEKEGWEVENDTVLIHNVEDGRLDYATAIRFDGWLVATPKGQSIEDALSINPNDPINQANKPYTEEDISVIESIQKLGPLHGVCTDWDNSILAFSAVPEQAVFPTLPAQEELENILSSYGNMHDRRPYASEIVAHQAGSQNSFGLTKGYQLLKDQGTRFLRTLAYCVADEALRPVHHREPNGSIVEFTNHPLHRTWHRTSYSGDFLGKGARQPYATTQGRFGHLETHIASYLHIYFALTGDYLAENWLESLCNRDMAAARPFSGWIGESRAVGRACQALANHYLLLPKYRDAMISIVEGRLHVIEKNWPGKKVLSQDPNRKILVLRHFNYLPDNNGVKQECASPWEEAKAACGLYALSQVLPEGNLADRCRNLALLISRTVLQWYFHDGNGWVCPYLCYYRTGEDEGLVCEKGYNTWQMHIGGSDWKQWTLGALKIYTLLQQNPQDEDLHLAKQILSEVAAPNNWLDAEWRAV